MSSSPANVTLLQVLGGAVLLAAMGGGLSCTDPVLDGAVENQGNETEGYAKGEFHRAGQLCVACHQKGGDASDSPFTMAGTVFAQPARQVGVDNAEIRFTDADGAKYTATTNCVGNFFVKADEWQPKFPVLVEVAKGNIRRSMRSPIGRSPDCAGCHSLDIPVADPFSQVGHIYLFGGDEPGQPNGAADCDADPVRTGSP